jgi:hypothetical protein
MSSIFPLEIEEIILDILSEDDEDHSALKTCSLVCQAFLPICRKHIFGSIVLNDSKRFKCPDSHEFVRLLSKSPEIADYVRKLDFTVRKGDMSIPSIQESLKRISRLESLTVLGWVPRTLNWSNNPIRPALLHLLHLRTLTHFNVTNFLDFVVSDLIPCVNLKYLHIGNNMSAAAENTFPATLPVHPIRLNEFVVRHASTIVAMKLFTARLPDGQLIIDFGSLLKITVGIQYPSEVEVSQELIRRCHLLTNVHIMCK